MKKIIICLSILMLIFYLDNECEKNRVSLLVYLESHNYSERLEKDVSAFICEDEMLEEDIIFQDEGILKKIIFFKVSHYFLMSLIVINSVCFGFLLQRNKKI